MTEGETPAPPEEPFDPYRFGKPDYPIPPEYAPPGYVPDVPAPAAPPPPHPFYGPTPYASIPTPYATPPAGAPGAYPPYQPYPQPPYGAYGQQPVVKSNGKAVASLVLGIASIVLCFFGLLDLIPIVLALVFGIQAIRLANLGRSDARGLAVAGVVCAIVGAIAATIFTVRAIQAIDKCGGVDNRDAPGFYTCVENHL